MEHELPAIFVVLEQSAFAAAIRQSPLLYPLANVGHILALMIFAGALTVMDLRLIGAFSATEPAFVLSRARRVAIAAFAALGVSGMMAAHLHSEALGAVSGGSEPSGGYHEPKVSEVPHKETRRTPRC